LQSLARKAGQHVPTGGITHVSLLGESRATCGPGGGAWHLTDDSRQMRTRRPRQPLRESAKRLRSCGIDAQSPSNPMDAVERPTAQRPPIRFYELADVERIVGRAPSRAMGALWALMYATGIEVSVALRLVRGDVDEASWQVRARSTKTTSRDRVCLVAEWARPALAAFMRDKLPAAPLWPGWNRFTPNDAHTAAAIALELSPIPLRNSRHHLGGARGARRDASRGHAGAARSQFARAHAQRVRPVSPDCRRAGDLGTARH